MFPVSRRVLIEKQTKTVRQIKCYLEQQFGDCRVYKYRGDDTYYYITKDDLLLEAQINTGYFYLNESLCTDIVFNKTNITHIFRRLFKLEIDVSVTMVFNDGDDYRFVLKHCDKIK